MDSNREPEPCRPQDWGKFEITNRDGAARIGKFHTRHGVVTTPMLLPVVNPNLRTIEPREMWDMYGIEALITNSYVIWKHEKLSIPAKSDGIHKLLNFPGAIVTDSGTFQSYVYGDVEVSPEEIVSFQREIGVDVGTMLDVFARSLDHSSMPMVLALRLSRECRVAVHRAREAAQLVQLARRAKART